MPAYISVPWMIGGDFNVVRTTDECFGSILLALTSWEFRDIIMDCALYDLPFVGSSYIWCKLITPSLENIR